MVSRTTRQAARAYQKAHGVPYAEALRRVHAEDTTNQPEQRQEDVGPTSGRSPLTPTGTKSAHSVGSLVEPPAEITPLALVNYLDTLRNPPPRRWEFSEAEVFDGQFPRDIYAEALNQVSQDWNEKTSAMRGVRQQESEEGTLADVESYFINATRAYAIRLEIVNRLAAETENTFRTLVTLAESYLDVENIAGMTGLDVAEVEALIAESGE